MTLNLPLLKTLSLTSGVSSDEARIRAVIEAEIAPHVDELRTDNLGNLIALKKGKSSDKKALVCAHMDEIGFLVKHIEDNGFLRVTTLGGFDPKTLITQRVLIHTESGDIPAVFGNKAKHELSPAEANAALQIKDLFLDTGLKAKDVKKRVRKGDIITRDSRFLELGDCLSSKSFDNRVSVYAVIETIKAVKTPAYDTYYVFTVQEEMGLRGASVISRQIDVDIVINLDVAPGSDIPGVAEDKHVATLGKGVAIRRNDGGHLADKDLFAWFLALAKKQKITHQPIVRDGRARTDTMFLQQGGKGTKAICLSQPLRYMHSYVETIHKDDLQSVIDLLIAAVKTLETFRPS